MRYKIQVLKNGSWSDCFYSGVIDENGERATEKYDDKNTAELVRRHLHRDSDTSRVVECE